jgi:alginate O-acetyltransferase complex protein AlgI
MRNRRVVSARNLLEFGMYDSLFPQLIAGPIVRYAEIERQIVSRSINSDRVAEGVYRFSLGLGKKLLLADPMGSIADAS